MMQQAAQVNSDWNAVSGVAEILNKPTIPAAQVNSDWNAVSGVAQILNKPTITSGTVTSVGLSMPAPTNAAFSVSGSPVTTSGTLAVAANGSSDQYPPNGRGNRCPEPARCDRHHANRQAGGSSVGRTGRIEVQLCCDVSDLSARHQQWAHLRRRRRCLLSLPNRESIGFLPMAKRGSSIVRPRRRSALLSLSRLPLLPSFPLVISDGPVS